MEKEVEKKAVAPIEIVDGFLPVPKTMQQLLAVGKFYVDSGMFPAHYDTPQKVMVALQFARELGFKDSPLVSLRQIAIIHGVPSIFGDLPLALVRKANVLESFSEYFVDANMTRICAANKNLDVKVFAAVACGKRRGEAESVESFFSMKDAENAGLYPPKKRDGTTSTDSPWFKYTATMLKYRARTRLLKDLAPDALSGVAVKEYDFPDDEGYSKAKPVSSVNNAALLEEKITAALD